MTTVYQSKTPGADVALADQGYTGYREPDTKVPPKAKPVLNEISVNGVPIEEAEILAEAQNHPADIPGRSLLEAAHALVVRELLWQEATKLAIEAEPETDQSGRIENNKDAAIRALIEREVEVPSASSEECRRYYDNNPGKFFSEPVFEARHIFFAAGHDDANARSAARNQATDIIEHLQKNHHEFSKLAKEYSQCPSKEVGGNLGQITRGATVDEFARALSALEDCGLASFPIETRYGFHVVDLTRKVDGKRLPFVAVRERIAAWIEASSWSKAVSQFISILAGEAIICGVDIDTTKGQLVT